MIFQNKKRHNSGAADLEKVTDYAEEKEILSTSTDLDDAIAVICRLHHLLVMSYSRTQDAIFSSSNMLCTYSISIYLVNKMSEDTKQISRHPCAYESDPELAFRMSESLHIALHAALAFDICSLGHQSHHIVQVWIRGYVNNCLLIEATLVLCMHFGIIIFDDESTIPQL